MTRLLVLILMISATLFTRAYVPAKVYSQGALARIVIKVLDHDGGVVPGVKIQGGFTCGSSLKDYVLVDCVTDTNGACVVEGRCNEFLRFTAQKDGYYQGEEKIYFGRSNADPIVSDGKWQPYGETRTVVLKKINQLGKLVIPDVGRPEVRSRKIPKFDCWIPFDLEKFDWNAPLGSGVHPDVLLRFRNRTTEFYYDFTYCMDVCFTNNPFAGVYEMKKDLTSDLKTSYKADPGAEYRSSFTYTSERTRDRKRKDDYLNDDAYLVFRTRTTVDAHGRLKSAHYGTLHGVWMSARDHMVLKDGCFNATANDLDIEDGYYLREKVKHYAE